MSKRKESTLRAIGSREYKLILNSGRFSDRGQGVAALQGVVCRLAETAGADTERQQKEERRRTHYLDTTEFHLRRSGFVVRVREEDGPEFKISLKHRTPDRYLAAAKDLRSSDKDDEPKFEEDILPPFHSVFSQSNSLRSGDEPKIPDVGALVGMFPGLKSQNLPARTTLEVVNHFRPVEVFVKLCKLKFDDGPKIKCGLGFWYHSDNDVWPLIAELAYDYETDHGDDFPLATVDGANCLFKSLQSQPGWFDLGESTKTRFAYEAMTLG